MKEKERLAIKESFTTLSWWIIDRLEEKKYSKHEVLKLQNAMDILNRYLEGTELRNETL